MADERMDHAGNLRSFANRLERGEPPYMILEVRGLRATANEIERLKGEVEFLRADGSAMRASITRLVEEVELLRRENKRLCDEIVVQRDAVCVVMDEAIKMYEQLLHCLPDADAGLPSTDEVRGILAE